MIGSGRLVKLGVVGGQALQWVVGLGMGGALIWYVAGHAGGGTGQVVLHVTEPDVQVTLGPIRFDLRDRSMTPVLVDLPAGRYDFRMRRGPETLLSRTFDLPGGGSVVLTAFDDREMGLASPADPTSPPGRTAP